MIGFVQAAVVFDWRSMLTCSVLRSSFMTHHKHLKVHRFAAEQITTNFNAFCKLHKSQNFMQFPAIFAANSAS